MHGCSTPSFYVRTHCAAWHNGHITPIIWLQHPSGCIHPLVSIILYPPSCIHPLTSILGRRYRRVRRQQPCFLCSQHSTAAGGQRSPGCPHSSRPSPRQPPSSSSSSWPPVPWFGTLGPCCCCSSTPGLNGTATAAQEQRQRQAQGGAGVWIWRSQFRQSV